MAAKFLVGGNATSDDNGFWSVVTKGKLRFVDKCFNRRSLEASSKVCPLNVI
ncbi:hypothetical protein D3C85_1663080 [compost metagenome]